MAQANNMTQFTYTPTVKVYDRKNFKTDKDIFNMVKASNIYAYDKDDKKFMKNFQSQYPNVKFDTSSIKNFVTSLFDFNILVPGNFAVTKSSDTKSKAPAKKGVSGVYDPNIFKVVFLAGGPGSGKSAVAQSLFGIKGTFSYIGLKTVNSDRFFEYLLKKEGLPSDFRNMQKELFEKITEGPGSIRTRSKNLNTAQFDSWIKGRLGVIIDGTGDNAKKLIAQAKFLKDTYGYEPLIVFVNTTLNKAIERNNKRERKLPEQLVREIWNSAQEALKEYKTYFQKSFIEVDNSKDVSKIEIDKKIQKEVATFLRKPPAEKKAKDWIEKELSLKKKPIGGISVKKVIGNGNKSTIDQIEKIVNSKKGKYLTIGESEKIKSIMLSNKYDPFNNEEDYKKLPSDIRELIEDSEMYYGFTENEIKRFLKKVNSLGYTFNYVDVATQNNEGFSHSFKPYALRKLTK